MIIDSSIIVAMLREEGDAEAILRVMNSAPRLLMSAGTHIELTVVLARRFVPEAWDRADWLLARFGVAIVPVTTDHAQIARAGYRKFGQASGHRAKLNFGDCFAYALAKATGEPLLFKGDDFGHTDITPAI